VRIRCRHRTTNMSKHSPHARSGGLQPWPPAVLASEHTTTTTTTSIY
jgi:hypothetical protein